MSAIVGATRAEARFTGTPGHAGMMAMPDRQDAGIAAEVLADTVLSLAAQRVRSSAGMAGLDQALRRLNALPDQEARMELLTCCGSRRWAARVSAGRPYEDMAALLAAADEAWDAVTEADIREAFDAHPRIGEAERGGAQERREQATAADADEATRAALREGNRAYEERFGHIYLVFASGRSAEDLLEDLRSRLGNDPATELRVAAEEQRKITRLRLERLVA